MRTTNLKIGRKHGMSFYLLEGCNFNRKRVLGRFWVQLVMIRAPFTVRQSRLFGTAVSMQLADICGSLGECRARLNGRSQARSHIFLIRNGLRFRTVSRADHRYVNRGQRQRESIPGLRADTCEVK